MFGLLVEIKEALLSIVATKLCNPPFLSSYPNLTTTFKRTGIREKGEMMNFRYHTFSFLVSKFNYYIQKNWDTRKREMMILGIKR
jgi:hypothetical protein